MTSKQIFFFGEGEADGSEEDKDILGGKGANLAEMTDLGVPVPPGFTLSTKVCFDYLEGKDYSREVKERVEQYIGELERIMERDFGGETNPLLVSVRSGAAVSMPGMMDTVLNLGLNEKTLKGLAVQSGSKRFALDCYRRFIQMFGNVVMGIDSSLFENRIEEMKENRGLENDIQLEEDSLDVLIEDFKKIYREETGKTFPDDVNDQLWLAISAVFDSWNNERAIKYRKINDISDDLGTAVNVQTMVFGNLGEDCATGVAFTRNPATGENEFYGEYLPNAQGEDVVAGIRTPLALKEERDSDRALEVKMPEAFEQLQEIRELLEGHYRDMQDIEFTVERGDLYMLQTRTGKRTGLAAVKMALDMVDEDLIDKKTALKRVDPSKLEQLLAPAFEREAKERALEEGKLLTRGLNAGPGAASGQVVLSADKAEDMVNNKDAEVILVRKETSPEDVSGMEKARGVLTARGGMTSHAAVVARGMGKSCVTGAKELDIDHKTKKIRVGDTVLQQGDGISIDGTTGEVIKGRLPTEDSEIKQVLIKENLKEKEAPVYQLFKRFMSWVEQYRDMEVRGNADTPEDVKAALNFGAGGIGLCRTEHMFFDKESIASVRSMILSDDSEERKEALSNLIEKQREDFGEILKAMTDRPVTIRLLDPPLHEFLPTEKEALEELAAKKNISVRELRKKIENLKEINPMLGHRGCRLGLTYPEIYEMQVKAIIEAACGLAGDGYTIYPEIMIPLVSEYGEIEALRNRIKTLADEIISNTGVDLNYKIGTMIEIPRAALLADRIAEKADFFSFGTNDLTQMTYGFSRDDSGSFLPAYIEQNIIESDPFQKLDTDGVGQLVKTGVERGRETKTDLKIGICGEHGGEPSSVEFCYEIGLDYVSCSPFRVPIAKLAAARASLE